MTGRSRLIEVSRQIATHSVRDTGPLPQCPPQNQHSSGIAPPEPLLYSTTGPAVLHARLSLMSPRMRSGAQRSLELRPREMPHV
ncbi:hypothetical protein [Streptomyces botrytidirepellens]|uniref:Uncharacterized protein n=1 Tax=Streptomyces botrytidirepellens TaxID=2486417 RepID=A0A3M8X550_9ACTN|nr:hypothetical protein [Streptomyces botrytidirepellens]RNG37366.1 hypothetical protein EEJ42_02265 [Streptomyces botrytidirepellens]